MIEKPSLKTALRQILAVLEEERLAFAGLDLDAIVLASRDKLEMCGALEALEFETLDEELLSMARAARDANAINRRIRNLVAANIATRIDMLSGAPRLYVARRRGASCD